MEHLPNRKHSRLRSDIYNRSGIYFITICTQNRSPCLGKIVWDESDMVSTAHCVLSEVGEVVQKYVCNIPAVYPYTVLDTFVIMPDHVHLLLYVHENTVSHVYENSKSPSTYTRLVQVIRSTKRTITKELGYSIWQTSFYDSIIRDEKALEHTRQYILQNPARWAMRYGIVPE